MIIEKIDGDFSDKVNLVLIANGRKEIVRARAGKPQGEKRGFAIVWPTDPHNSGRAVIRIFLAEFVEAQGYRFSENFMLE